MDISKILVVFSTFGPRLSHTFCGNIDFRTSQLYAHKEICLFFNRIASRKFTHARYFGVSFPKNNEALISASNNELSIMSFNVRLFDAYQLIVPKIEDSKAEFTAFFEENPTDILCLQEYAKNKSNNKLISPSEIKKI